MLNSSLCVLKMIRKVLGSYHPILKTFHMSQTRTFNNGVMMGVVNKKNSHTHIHTHTHTHAHTQTNVYTSRFVRVILDIGPRLFWRSATPRMGRKEFENAEPGPRQYHEECLDSDTKMEISYKPPGLYYYYYYYYY